MNKPVIDTHHVQVHGQTFVPLLSAEEVEHAVRQIAKDISAYYQDKDPLCIAILNGAFIFAADLVRSLNFDPEIAFIKVASYQQMASTGQVNEVIGLDTDLTGRDVIVIEDIIDTGHTIAYLHRLLQERGAASIAFTALLLKKEAYQYDIPIDYVGFNIANRFVIGCGLDYDGHGRALRGVYVLKED
jgi:hypoxanthine phosphoribosyltransferase